MFGITTLRNALTTLAANVTALGQTVAEVNAGLRARLNLDGQEAPQLPGPVIEHGNGNGQPAKRRSKAAAE